MAKVNDPDLGKRPAPLNGDADARSRQRRAREKDKVTELQAWYVANFGERKSTPSTGAQSWAQKGHFAVKY